MTSFLVEETTSSSVTNVLQDREGISISEDVLVALRDFVHRSYPRSLKHRQFEHILKEEQLKRAVTKGARNAKASLARQGNKCGGLECGDVATKSISKDVKPTSEGSR